MKDIQTLVSTASPSQANDLWEGEDRQTIWISDDGTEGIDLVRVPPREVEGLQSVTVTFAIDAVTREEATARFVQFWDAWSVTFLACGVLAAVIEPVPTPGDLAGRIIGQ